MQRNQRLAVGGAITAVSLGLATFWSFASAGAPSAGTFNQAAMNVSANCQQHQASQPSSTYTAGTNANTGKVLRMLRYYTAFGNTAFCDGKAPSAADVAWARLYVDLGADQKNVAKIVAG
jgi:hypothetical protein